MLPDTAAPARPIPAAPTPTEAEALRELFEREQAVLRMARHGRAIRLRYVLVAVAMLIPLLDPLLHVFTGPWQLLVAGLLLTGAGNAAAHWCWRRERAALWHFWALLGLETLVIGVGVGVAGPAGPLTIPFFITAAVAYGIGMPHAARVQLALASVVYPVARVAGYVLAGVPVAAGLLVLELFCLLGLGMLALRGTTRHHAAHAARAPHARGAGRARARRLHHPPLHARAGRPGLPGGELQQHRGGRTRHGAGAADAGGRA